MSQKRRTETDIMIEVLKALYDLPGVWVYRNNCGVAKPPGAARAIRFGLPGQGDLSGIVQVSTPRGVLGVRLEVEVKTPTGKISPEQIAFGARITEMGRGSGAGPHGLEERSPRWKLTSRSGTARTGLES